MVDVEEVRFEFLNLFLSLGSGMRFGIIPLPKYPFSIDQRWIMFWPILELIAIEVCVDESIVWKQFWVDYILKTLPNHDIAFLEKRSRFTINFVVLDCWSRPFIIACLNSANKTAITRIVHQLLINHSACSSLKPGTLHGSACWLYQ